MCTDSPEKTSETVATHSAFLPVAWSNEASEKENAPVGGVKCDDVIRRASVPRQEQRGGAFG